MLYDGIKLAEGSDAKNLVVETGTAFPTGPGRNPDAGELFYRTDVGNVGLWAFDGFVWQRLGSGSTLPDITAAGTYRSVTVSTKGLVTAGTNPTTLSGYGITDAAPLGHVGAGGGAHPTATVSVAGFMSATDKTKLDGLNIGTAGGTIPLLNASNIWSGAQTFTGMPIRMDANTVGTYSVFQTYHAGGSSTPSWAISMETDRDYQIEARDTLGASAVRIRVDHASAASGSVLFVGPSTLTYGGNSIYHAGNLSFGSGLSFNSGVLTATGGTYTAGNGLTLTGSQFALSGSFNGNTLYHSGNLSFGSGLTFSAGVLTATGGGGAGNINYTPVALGAGALIAGSRTLATIVNNDPAWASTVAVLPLRTGFTEDKSSISFTASATNAAINNTNLLFSRNTLFLNGTATDASPGTANFVQATSGDFPTALRLTGQATFSIDCWLYNTGTGIRFVAGNLVDNLGTMHWSMMLNTTSGGAATVALGTTGATYRFGTAAFPQNEWRYVRISATGGQIACFTATAPGAAETQLGTTLAYTNATIGNTTAPFRIGRASAWATANGYPFSGSIANFRVTIGNARGGVTASTAPAADFIGDIADFTLPATIAAGDVFAVRNAAANAGTSFARVLVDSNRRVRPFAQGEVILAAPGEEITMVASSNTELEIIAPQFDPRDIPQTIRNQNFTFGMGDRGELAIKTDVNAYTWTIALDGVVNLPIGTTILVGNDSSTGNVTITPAGGVTLLDGAAVGAFTLLPNTFRSLVKVGVNRWRIS